MNRALNHAGIAGLILIICLYVSGVRAQQGISVGRPSPPTLVWGAPNNDLQISLSPDVYVIQTSRQPPLVLNLRNVGTSELFLMDDVHCGGDPFGTRTIYLTIADSSGKSGRLEYIDPNIKTCGPPYNAIFTINLLPYVETDPLRAQPARIPINLDYYQPDPNLTPEEKSRVPDWRRGGTFILQAEMGSGTHRINHWEKQGTAISNRLEIHISPL